LPPTSEAPGANGAFAGLRGQPLGGLRVVDCSTVLAGPYCTMVLADLGADVVKVEPPEGDATRGWGPPWVGEGPTRTAAYYLAVNRNKRSIALDLRTADGLGTLRRLLGRADVFVENFRRGGLERLGLDDETLSEINPRLIHGSVSGYGRWGPDAERPGYDFVAQAVGGLMSVTGSADEDGGEPTKVGVAISDVATGLFLAIGILAKLVELEKIGTIAGTTSTSLSSAGDVAARRASIGRVDTALLSSTLALLINQAQNAFVTGRQPARRGNAHPNIVPYEAFATVDRPIVVAVGSERQWRRFCDAVGLGDLASDPRFTTNADRVVHRDELQPLIANRLATRPAADWLAALEAADVPCGPINDILDAFASPQATTLGMTSSIAHPVLGQVRQVGSPLVIDQTVPAPRRPPPLLGEHTDEILRELG
jgi:crotonobetainyl-CoA:carnitine CoA-transferase CaiB-like acyl-CoA transferase